MNIEVPVSVKNAIEDVFMENDDVETVDCYHREDLNFFTNDLEISNNVSLELGGKNYGNISNVWTYYGEIEYSYSEKIGLYDKNGNILEKISDIESSEPTEIINEDDWVVTLVEVVSWGDSESSENPDELDRNLKLYGDLKNSKNPDELSRNLKLYIYCPVSLEDNL